MRTLPLALWVIALAAAFTLGRYGPPERPYPVSAVMEQVRIEPAS